MEVSLEAIRRDAETMLSVGSMEPKSPSEVFDRILQELEPIDFAAEAGVGPDGKVTQRHRRVVTVRTVIAKAKECDCGLARRLDFVYVFNSCFWQLVDDNDLEHFLGKAAAALGVELSLADDYEFRKKLFKQFLSAAFLPMPEKVGSDILVNLRNGTLELGQGGYRVREFRREDFLTYQLPFAYDPNATAPKWGKFLVEVLKDAEKRQVLAEFFGYLFLRDLKLEKALILYGTGANGKSVVFEVINGLLGAENVTNYSLESLGDRYFRGLIANALLNYCSDISNRIQADAFKLLVSGEPIEARFPYGQPFMMKRYARLAFNTNELPSSDIEHSEAFFRRFLIIHFDEFIPEERRNPNLAKEIIQSELPGVLNWVIGGLQRLVANGRFSECQSARAVLAEYRTESDTVALFLEEEGYRPSDTEWINLKVLYQQYRTYCTDNGYKPTGNKTFSKRMQGRGISVNRNAKGKTVFVTKSWDAE